MPVLSPGNGVESPLHRVDTRAKMLISVLASLLTVVLNSAAGQLVLFACSALYALSMRRFKLLAAAYLIVALMLCVAGGCAALIHEFVPRMPATPPDAMLIPFLRLAIMVNVILPLAFSSRIQSLLTALKSLKLPFVLYIPLAVTIRFIPTFLFDMRQIAEALRIRGYRLGFKQCALHPVLCLRFVTVPLLFRSLKTSEDLGVAAELKGLGATGSLKPYRVLHWRRSDSLLMLAVLLACAAALACHHYLGVPVNGGMR